MSLTDQHVIFSNSIEMPVKIVNIFLQNQEQKENLEQTRCNLL